MATAHDPDGQDTSPYLRVPWPLAALGILVVLGVFLGLGLWATQSRRAASAAPPVSAPTAGPITTPAPVVATIRPTTVETPSSVAPLVPTQPIARATETVVPRDLPLAGTVTPSPTVTPASAATATVDPQFAHEIDDFYRHYWEVRAAALLTLDTSDLPEVADGEHLKALEQFIRQLKEENHAINTQVHHDYLLISASQSAVVLLDRYVDMSVYVDLGTREALTKPGNDHLDEQYELKKIADKWKVISLARAD